MRAVPNIVIIFTTNQIVLGMVIHIQENAFFISEYEYSIPFMLERRTFLKRLLA